MKQFVKMLTRSNLMPISLLLFIELKRLLVLLTAAVLSSEPNRLLSMTLSVN